MSFKNTSIISIVIVVVGVIYALKHQSDFFNEWTSRGGVTVIVGSHRIPDNIRLTLPPECQSENAKILTTYGEKGYIATRCATFFQYNFYFSGSQEISPLDLSKILHD